MPSGPGRGKVGNRQQGKFGLARLPAEGHLALPCHDPGYVTCQRFSIIGSWSCTSMPFHCFWGSEHFRPVLCQHPSSSVCRVSLRANFQPMTKDRKRFNSQPENCFVLVPCSVTDALIRRHPSLANPIRRHELSNHDMMRKTKVGSIYSAAPRARV